MRRVLLVDDEMNVLNALRRTLRQYFPDGEFQTETFTDPEAALVRCAAVPFDAVIADYRMPGINGAEFLRVVKTVQPETVRIALSASTEFSEVMDVVNRAEIFRFVSKPWQAEEMRATLLEAFAKYDASSLERRLADEMRARLEKLSPQEIEARRLEAAEPGITQVNWGSDGSVLLD